MNEDQLARMQTFHFRLTGQEVDQVIAALMERPMKEVLQVFGKLQNQLRPQLQPASGDRPCEPNGEDKEIEEVANTGEGEEKHCQSSVRRRAASAPTQ